jgi:hypothetical protein
MTIRVSAVRPELRPHHRLVRTGGLRSETGEHLGQEVQSRGGVQHQSGSVDGPKERALDHDSTTTETLLVTSVHGDFMPQLRSEAFDRERQCVRDGPRQWDGDADQDAADSPEKLLDGGGEMEVPGDAVEAAEQEAEDGRCEASPIDADENGGDCGG